VQPVVGNVTRLRRVAAIGRIKWIADSRHGSKDNFVWALFSRPSGVPAIFIGRAPLIGLQHRRAGAHSPEFERALLYTVAGQADFADPALGRQCGDCAFFRKQPKTRGKGRCGLYPERMQGRMGATFANLPAVPDCGPMTTKTYEQRLADLIRLLASDQDGEALAATRALGRLLASRDASFNDLGAAVEKLATGGLEEAEMKRIFDAAYAKGREDVTRQQFAADGVYGLRPDGSHDWERIALFCQRENARLKPNEKTFVDDMAGRLTFPGRQPTEKQSAWLLAIFRRLGGRLT
jgi:hypothetical protein